MNNLNKFKSNPYIDYIESKLDNRAVDVLTTHKIVPIADCVKILIDKPEILIHTENNDPILFYINPIMTFADQAILSYTLATVNIENKEELISPIYLAAILFCKALNEDGTRVYFGKTLKEAIEEILNYPFDIVSEIDKKISEVYKQQFKIMSDRLVETLQDKANKLSKSAQEPDNILEKNMHAINEISKSINKLPLDGMNEPAINSRFFESSKLHHEEQRELQAKSSKKK